MEADLVGGVTGVCGHGAVAFHDPASGTISGEHSVVGMLTLTCSSTISKWHRRPSHSEAKDSAVGFGVW